MISGQKHDAITLALEEAITQSDEKLMRLFVLAFEFIGRVCSTGSHAIDQIAADDAKVRERDMRRLGARIPLEVIVQRIQ
ncbi:hypothetical protein [Rhizobium sp. 007]|uniref:hypothetical protein n=1 Tax=Rhizobium sp. 007 TaxID=2785056 RepID=UPI001FF0088B|nr:hypothetical protein [Rhizobium sp. 007]